MTSLKTTVTLAAIVSLTAALAPSSASAFGGFGRTHAKSAPHPVAAQHGARVAWHGARPSFRPAIVAHRPFFPARLAWHRPVEIKVVHEARPHFFRVGTPAYVTAPTVVAAPPPIVGPVVRAQAAVPVNGLNVMVVDIPNGQYRMTAAGQWVKQQSDGKTFQFTEDKRDESSVYVTDASRGVSLQLDLSQKQVFLLAASSKRAVFPIVAVSAQ